MAQEAFQSCLLMAQEAVYPLLWTAPVAGCGRIVRMLDITAEAKCNRIRGLFMKTGYARLTDDQVAEVSYCAVIYGLVLKDFRRD